MTTRSDAAASALDPAFAADPTVEVADVSVWFGPKVALSELSCSFGPGVTGLLGPERRRQDDADAGDHRAWSGSTRARCRVEGRDPRRDRRVHARMALVPEDEAVPAGLTARQFVRYAADLHGIADRGAPGRRAGDGRPCSTSPTGASTGSARACASAPRSPRRWSCDPQVLVLDEPLNGADPVQRVSLISLFRRLGADGRTVIVSSHVLNEVERLAERVIVLVHGRLAAAGGHRAIRDAMDDRPRHVLVRADATPAPGRRARRRSTRSAA